MVLLALLLRLRAAAILPVDDDEPTYLQTSRIYARYLAEGQPEQIIRDPINYVHPPLVKLVFGAVLYATQDRESYAQPLKLSSTSSTSAASAVQQLYLLRIVAALVGALTAGLVARVEPLAGLLLAVNAWHIIFSSELLLEAIPCFFAAAALLLLRRSQANGDRPWWLAAVALGAAAAGKYLYGVAGLAAAIWIVCRDRRAWPMVIPWCLAVATSFYLLDPVLWRDPLPRLWDSLTHSIHYAGSSPVARYNFRWFQPLYWLIEQRDPWYPPVSILPLSGPLSLVALLGAGVLWRRDPLLVLWSLANLLFLLIWPVKWPQYVTILSVPTALLGSQLIERARERHRQMTVKRTGG